MAEDWKLQVSYKTPSGDMINVRAQTADELSVLLEGIGDYSHPPPVSSAPPQAQAPSATAPATPVQGGPTCQHGPRKYKSGISSKTGNPYAMWVCPMPQGADQCKPVN